MHDISPTLSAICRVSTSDIRETAGWDQSHAVISYLTGPVTSTISVIAGHIMNTYIMRRDRVPVPAKLLELVFPGVPAELERITKVRRVWSSPCLIMPYVNM